MRLRVCVECLCVCVECVRMFLSVASTKEFVVLRPRWHIAHMQMCGESNGMIVWWVVVKRVGGLRWQRRGRRLNRSADVLQETNTRTQWPTNCGMHVCMCVCAFICTYYFSHSIINQVLCINNLQRRPPGKNHLSDARVQWATALSDSTVLNLFRPKSLNNFSEHH